MGKSLNSLPEHLKSKPEQWHEVNMLLFWAVIALTMFGLMGMGIGFLLLVGSLNEQTPVGLAYLYLAVSVLVLLYGLSLAYRHHKVAPMWGF